MGHFERLSALDASFLEIETPRSSMAVGAVCVFAGGEVVDATGAVDAARVRAYIEGAIARLPRYRQRMVRVPVVGQPVWVDDERFVLDFHVRHTRLPAPGDDAQLDALAGRLFSQRLDRDHPLWEAWIVEGLRDRRFALITKVHHAMIDGVAGADLLAQLLRFTPDASVAAAPPWTPRPHPRGAELLRAEIGHHNRRVGAGLAWARDHLRAGVPAELRASGRGIVEAMRAGLAPAPATRLNPPRIGPHRRFTTLGFDLAAIKQVKAALGGTINDVVLATVTGGLRRYLQRHGDDPDRLGSLRALMPVNIRAATDAAGGNHVAMLLVPLPVDEPDPTRRLAAVSAASKRLRTESDQVAGVALFEQIADAIATGLVSNVFRLAARLRAFNVTVTNVPGPPMPLYLLGARLEGIYPLVPLFERQAVGVALFSYAGSLDVGLVTCWHTVPDLAALAADVRAAFAELQAVARAAPPRATDAAAATAR
ncbi:MAG: wax ester/triacylglycerol synthase family O-acyltransferase [Myxococcales bacterium]|nr:wax ester/triacylglycerol synthase family O-acyltransferase [Myxococcales bacterium]